MPMNLTVNIPVDFDNMEECRHILSRSKKGMEMLYKQISNGHVDLSDVEPMTQEENDRAMEFLTKLKKYIDDNPISFHKNKKRYHKT